MSAAKTTPRKSAAPASVEKPAGAAPGLLRPEVIAFVSTQPINLAAMVAAQHAPAAFRGGATSMDPLKFADAIEIQAALVQAGDLSGVEESLLAQSIALQAMFTELSTKAARSGDIETKNVYYSLALRAQSQANATLKTLVELKQPRQAIFTKNAAVNQGTGPQQVVMGVPAASPAQAREPHSEQNELNALEVGNGGTPMDAGATRPAIGNRAQEAAMVGINRAAKQARKARVVG